MLSEIIVNLEQTQIALSKTRTKHRCKVRKTVKIRNQYNQVPHLTQDTTWESDKTTMRNHKQEPTYGTVNSIFVEIQPDSTNIKNDPRISYCTRTHGA